MRRATGLSCSIGIAPNKLLAKIASELQKPDGLTVLTYADLATRIWPLPARRINGVGPRASARLETLGIRTIGELAQAPVGMLIEHFGERYGRWLADAAQGHDERPVVTEREPKSVSRETTFERDLDPERDRDALSRTLLALCERVGSDLAAQGLRGQDHRREAALRRLSDRDARYDARVPDGRPTDHTQGGEGISEARCA